MLPIGSQMRQHFGPRKAELESEAPSAEPVPGLKEKSKLDYTLR